MLSSAAEICGMTLGGVTVHFDTRYSSSAFGPKLYLRMRSRPLPQQVMVPLDIVFRTERNMKFGIRSNCNHVITSWQRSGCQPVECCVQGDCEAYGSTSFLSETIHGRNAMCVLPRSENCQSIRLGFGRTSYVYAALRDNLVLIT